MINKNELENKIKDKYIKACDSTTFSEDEDIINFTLSCIDMERDKFLLALKEIKRLEDKACERKMKILKEGKKDVQSFAYRSGEEWAYSKVLELFGGSL